MFGKKRYKRELGMFIFQSFFLTLYTIIFVTRGSDDYLTRESVLAKVSLGLFFLITLFMLALEIYPSLWFDGRSYFISPT
jgi:hypothetical protein